MSVPTLTGTRYTAPGPRRPLLVCGPSLGTSAEALWADCADLLAGELDVLAWDLPGHGRGTPSDAPFTAAELAAGVLALVDDVLTERGEPGGTFAYAGDSVGGAIGLQLLLDHPGRVSTATLLCTGARIEAADGWDVRAALARTQGTGALVAGAIARWFAPGFADRQPDVHAGLVDALRIAAAADYASVCELLAGFDVRARLAEITVPVLAVAGAHDAVTPPELLRAIADGVSDGRLVVLDDVAHLAPAEAPTQVAALIAGHAVLTHSVGETRAAGRRVRSEVLGQAHVERATAASTELTRDFQDFITQYAWGSIWTRPGLDRRSRSMITLTALVAGGHHDELALHVRAALTNGLSADEIKEVLLHSAIYCGVPAANTAFRIAAGVIADSGDKTEDRREP